MGNSSSDLPPPSGARVLRCKELFKLKQDNIEAFWEVFRRFDFNREGLITRESFFEGIIREERNEFGDAIFSIVDTEHNEHLEFGEFVQAVCTFCCFSVLDMLKFCFMVYDKDRSGFMEMEELHHLITALHNCKVSNNVQSAMGQLRLDDHGRLPFDGFKLFGTSNSASTPLFDNRDNYYREIEEADKTMNRNFPQVLYPVFRLQQSTRRRILGSVWWKRKVNELENWRENREHMEQMENSKESQKKKRQRDAQIRKAMGLKEYFLNPKKRQIYVEALSQSVPSAPPPGAAAATSTPFSEGVAPR